VNPVEFLGAHSGSWTGSNTLQDPHSGKPEESSSTATLTPVLDGRFVRVDYTWDYQGKPQEGSLLIGYDPKSGEVSGHWIDSWHMGRKVLNCVGTSTDDGTFAVRGSWAAPPGPDWGWRITIGKENDTLRITHTVIDPEGQEDLAAEGVYPLA
jgi:hypothetical protein